MQCINTHTLMRIHTLSTLEVKRDLLSEGNKWAGWELGYFVLNEGSVITDLFFNSAVIKLGDEQLHWRDVHYIDLELSRIRTK